MKDTINSLLESNILTTDFETQNILEYANNITQINESAVNMFKYSPEKVIVNIDENNKYFVEFAGNLERYMRDEDVNIDEAMTEVAECNNIAIEECTVVFDESCVDKIDFGELTKSNHAFKLARM